MSDKTLTILHSNMLRLHQVINTSTENGLPDNLLDVLALGFNLLNMSNNELIQQQQARQTLSYNSVSLVIQQCSALLWIVLEYASPQMEQSSVDELAEIYLHTHYLAKSLSCCARSKPANHCLCHSYTTENTYVGFLFQGIFISKRAIPQYPVIPANSSPAPTKPDSKKNPEFTR